MSVKNPGPVVLVGLPRSGSTLLTAIVNQSPDHYVLNDLYYLQLIDSQGSWEGFHDLDEARAAKALVREMVHRRAAVHSPKGIANSAEMSEEQLDCALAAIDAQWPRPEDTKIKGDWASVLENCIKAAAQAVGKDKWGWNTPQDYHHIDRLIAKWPDARIVFLLRDPRKTLNSYKYYPRRPQADRYHPLVQSIAWRNAARAWLRFSVQMPDNLMMMTYEDLVGDTPSQLRRLNAFVPSKIPTDLKLAALGSNSSHVANGHANIERILTPVELWISDRVLYSERVALGFREPPNGMSLEGWRGLLRTSFRFAKFYGREAVTSAETRKKINRLLRPR